MYSLTEFQKPVISVIIYTDTYSIKKKFSTVVGISSILVNIGIKYQNELVSLCNDVQFRFFLYFENIISAFFMNTELLILA